MSTHPCVSWFATPNSFPYATFEGLKDRIVPRFNNRSRELNGLLGGFNGVRFRLRACIDHSRQFVESLQRFGGAPPIEEYYNQDRELFGFFMSGLSTFESF